MNIKHFSLILKINSNNMIIRKNFYGFRNPEISGVNEVTLKRLINMVPNTPKVV